MPDRQRPPPAPDPATAAAAPPGARRGVLDGPLHVTGALTLDTLVLDGIQVAGGASLRLTGVCCGSLDVGAGGKVTVTGTVCGDLRAHGDVELDGVVLGDLVLRGGRLTRGPRAVVRGKVRVAR